MAVAVVALLAGAACGDDSDDDAGDGDAGTPEAADAAAVVSEVVGGFDTAEPSSFDRVEELVALGPEALAEVRALVERDELSTRWAGVYTLVRLHDEVEGDERTAVVADLEGLLDDPAVTVRTMAAGGLTLMGERSGIPVLIDGLSEEGTLAYSEPPKLVASYAQRVLAHYTGPELGADARRWRTWWEEHGKHLVWSPEDRRFEVRR